MPKRLAALSAEAALETGGRHAVEIAIEGIELVITVDGAKHTMTPVRAVCRIIINLLIHLTSSGLPCLCGLRSS